MKIGIVGTRKIYPCPKQQREIIKSLRKSLRTKNSYCIGNTFGIPSFVAELLAYKKKEIILVKHWNGRSDLSNHYLETLANTSVGLNIPKDVVPSGAEGLVYRCVKEMNEQIIKFSDKIFLFYVTSRSDVITEEAIRKCNCYGKQYFLININDQNDIKI